MGLDIVQIGLRHNLPVDNPFATAEEVAKRMRRNIKLVYRNSFEYEIKNNIVRLCGDYPRTIPTWPQNHLGFTSK